MAVDSGRVVVVGPLRVTGLLSGVSARVGERPPVVVLTTASTP